MNNVHRRRDCRFTHLTASALSCKDVLRFPNGLATATKKRKRQWVLNNGTLICRYVHTIYQERHSKASYKGEVRYLYPHEGAEFCNDAALPGAGGSLGGALDTDNVPATPASVRIEAFSTRIPQKTCDIFCGAGGATEGAKDAGFAVKFGLDIDAQKMETYLKNNPYTQGFIMDAGDFPAMARRCKHGNAHCHFSTCCNYWAMC